MSDCRLWSTHETKSQKKKVRMLRKIRPRNLQYASVERKVEQFDTIKVMERQSVKTTKLHGWFDVKQNLSIKVCVIMTTQSFKFAPCDFRYLYKSFTCTMRSRILLKEEDTTPCTSWDLLTVL